MFIFYFVCVFLFGIIVGAIIAYYIVSKILEGFGEALLKGWFG